jgi:hypothetical protein
MAFQVRLLECYIKIINTLDPNRYEFNLRPYPIEDMKKYLDIDLVKNKILTIDSSIDFTSWICNQDIIIGPTSTTLPQLAMAKSCFINVDLISGRVLRQYDQEMFPFIQKHCPSDYGHLFEMIDHFTNYKIHNQELSTKLHNIYNFGSSKPVSLLIAKDIINTLTNHGNNFQSRLPSSLFRIMDTCWLNYYKVRYKKKIPSDYSFFQTNQC